MDDRNEDKSKERFLGARMKELREINGVSTQDEMAKRIDEFDGIEKSGTNKSSISRAESGSSGMKTIEAMAEKYCKVFRLTKNQREQFFRGKKIAVPDTSALLKNPHLIDELNEEYSKVIIPNIVLDELDNLKNRGSISNKRKAWEVISSIRYGDRIMLREYEGEKYKVKNDNKIICVAKEISKELSCNVDIVTEDVDYSAYLKGNQSVKAVHLREYISTKQKLINNIKINKLDNYYGDKYESFEPLTKDEANAYLQDGNTLIISVVRKNGINIEEKKTKIRWLIQHDADVNKRDCSRRYFPALSHAIQKNDYEMFIFLLNECKANPNVGSRNPFDSGKLRQKNEGNMPLMVAAWEGKKKFVEALCDDERTSINQQDANGFTALMKACMNGHFANDREKHTKNIKKIIIDAGADEKIVDINGRTAEDWVNKYKASGPERKQFNRGNEKNNKKRGKR